MTTTMLLSRLIKRWSSKVTYIPPISSLRWQDLKVPSEYFVSVFLHSFSFILGVILLVKRTVWPQFEANQIKIMESAINLTWSRGLTFSAGPILVGYEKAWSFYGWRGCGEEISSFHSSVLVRPYLEYCCVQFWVSYFKKDLDKLEKVQLRKIKMIIGLENITCKEKWKD